MCSTETTLDQVQRDTLLHLAHASIAHGLRHDCALPVVIADYPPALQTHRASFVTLEIASRLRGCIGTLEAHQALVKDIADNAYNAAFRDPRFTPVTADESARLDIHISVLSPPEPITFRSEAELLAQLRPGIDGLILSAPGHRGTFLPSVWEQLPRAEEFLQQLKRKAGLPADYWSPQIEVERYTAEVF